MSSFTSTRTASTRATSTRAASKIAQAPVETHNPGAFDTNAMPEDADPIAFHLQACQTIAVERARSAFSHYMSDLEMAFNADLDTAKSSSGHIDSVLDKVLMDIKSDVKSITDTLVQLNSFSQTITRRQAAIEKRASVMYEGKTRLRTVKIHVYEHLTKRTEGKELPSALLLFLFQPWTDYLCYSALRYGEDSNPWKQAFELVDDLIWAIKPKFSTEDKAKHALVKKSILKDVATGFKTIRYDEDKSQNMLTSLTTLMNSAFHDLGAAPAEPSIRTALQNLAQKKAFKEIGTPTEPTDNEQQIIKLLRAIEFGTWFEFKNGKRLKVAWYNSRTSHYMLVDETGKKSDMLSGQNLARALLNKQAKILYPSNKKPLLTRALESMFNQTATPHT